MDVNIILEWTIFGLALAMGGFFAAILLAAIRTTNERVDQPLNGLKAASAFSLPGSDPPAATAAQCYYDCMSSFRWDSEWGTLCSEACPGSTKGPKV